MGVIWDAEMALVLDANQGVSGNRQQVFINDCTHHI